MSRTDPEKKPRIILKLIVATILITGLAIVWTSMPEKSKKDTKQTWVDDAGKLHVLGIVLGESTLRESEAILKSRSDIALYIYPQSHARAGRRLEAYFPAIADHSKVILELQTSKTILDEIERHATLPHLYPNEVARMNLHADDLSQVQHMAVSSLTLIPNLELTTDMLTARFGQPATETTDSNGVVHYLFPAIGLDARAETESLMRLTFHNPVFISKEAELNH